MNDPIRHRVAKCRWCGGPFVKTFNYWLCESPGCAARQLEHAVAKREPIDGASPYLFVPLPLQVDLLTSTVKRLLMAGAAGASKSYGARWLVYILCRKFPGFRALLLRCSLEELNRNHLQWIPAEAAQLGDCKWSGGNVRTLTFENGSMVYCGYCDDSSDIPRHLGADWDLPVFEEGVNFLPQALSDISARDRGSLSRRAIEDNCDGRTLIVSNPGGKAMLYLIDHYIKRDPDRADYPNYNPSIYGFIKANLEDNPFLNENYASETLSGLNTARYQQLRFGDWTVFAGQFFSSFNPAKHITPLDVAAFA